MFISQSSLLKSLCLFCCLSITSLFTAATHSWTATNTNTTDFNWYSNYFRVTVSNIYLKKYADPPWYNDNWQYREVVAISNRAPTNISNYQARILLNLPAGKYETDLDDLRVCGSAGTNLLTFYAEDHSDNSTNAIIWAKLPYMPANTETRVYIYHGNPAAPRADDYYATFSYDTEQPVYHVLFADGRNDFSISSLVSNNTVNSSAYSYGQLKNNQSVGALGTSVSVLGPVSSKPDQDDTEGLSPVSWASTNFAFKGFRDGSGFRIKALYDSTTVSFYKNNNSSAWNTRMLNAGEYEYESGGSLGSSDTAVIISDKPVLAVFDTSGSRDSAILTPGNREILGTPTSSGYVTALYDNTEVVEYRSDSDTPVTNTLAQRGDYFSPGGSADQGSGAAVLIRADLPVAVNSQADMDGNESVSWLCQKNISAEYIIPVASEYIAIVCPYEDTQIDIIESGIPINSANSGTHWHSGPITHPGKIYFSGNFNANVRIKGDKPFYMFYEYRSKDDETQAFGVNDSRKYIFPEPEITAVTNEIIGSGVPPTLPWVKPAAQLSTYDISYWSNFQAGGLRTNGGYINFQLSTNNGSQWLYHDGSQWTDTGGNLSNNNTITSINNNLPDTSLINTTGLTWRALFYSDGTNNLGFHRINIDYERSQTLCLLPNISSLSFYQTNSFIWSNHPDLSSYLVIAEDPGFTITNTVISNLSTTNIICSNINTSRFMEETNYYWTVYTKDINDYTVAAQNTEQFKFKNHQPALDYLSNLQEIFIPTPLVNQKKLYWSVTDPDIIDENDIITVIDITNTNSGGFLSITNTNNQRSLLLTDITNAMFTDNTFYKWRAKIKDRHMLNMFHPGVWSNFYYNLSNNAPLAPANLTNSKWFDPGNHVLSASSIFYFSASDSDYFDSITYHYQISDDNFTSFIINGSTTNTNIALNEMGSLSEGGPYYFRVRAEDNRGAFSPYTTNSYTFIFTNGQGLPIAYPAYSNTAANIGQTNLLTWTNYYSTNLYKLEIAPDPAFTNIISTTLALTNSNILLSNISSVINLENQEVYYYRLTTYDTNGNGSPASPSGAFKFQDNYQPLFLGASNRAEMYLESPDNRDYTLYFHGSEPQNRTLYYNIVIRSTNEAYVSTNRGLTAEKLSIPDMADFTSFPDNVMCEWFVISISNCHSTEYITGDLGRTFFLNKSNNTPSGPSNFTVNNHADTVKLYLNDDIAIKPPRDPDIYNKVYNLFTASPSPSFFPAFTVYTTNNAVTIGEFTNGANFFTNIYGDNQTTYLKVRSIDDNAPVAAQTIASNLTLTFKKSYRLNAPFITAPAADNMQLGYSDIIAWTNYKYIPSQGRAYQLRVSTNASFSVTNVLLSNLTSNSISVKELGFTTAPQTNCYFDVIVYYEDAGTESEASTNVTSYIFSNEHLPVFSSFLLTTNRINAFDPNANYLEWTPSTDADGDFIYYDLYILSNDNTLNFNSIVCSNMNLTNTSITYNNLTNTNTPFQDNTRYWVIISNVRDSHGAEVAFYTNFQLLTRDFFLNISNSSPYTVSNISLISNSNKITATNYQLVNEKYKLNYQADDPDRDNISYILYIFGLSNVNLTNLTNTNNYDLTETGTGSKVLYSYETTDTNCSFYNILKNHYAGRQIIGDGSNFIIGIQSKDDSPPPAAISPLRIYSNILTLNLVNDFPTSNAVLFFTNGNVVDTNNRHNIFWTNAADPDPEDTLFYDIQIAEDIYFSNLTAYKNNIPENSILCSRLNPADLDYFTNLNKGTAYYTRIRGYDAYGGTNFPYTSPLGFYFTNADDVPQSSFLPLIYTNEQTVYSLDKNFSCMISADTYSRPVMFSIRQIPLDNLPATNSLYQAYKNLMPQYNITNLAACFYKVNAVDTLNKSNINIPAGISYSYKVKNNKNRQLRSLLQPEQNRELSEYASFFRYNTVSSNFELLDNSVSSGTIQTGLSNTGTFMIALYEEQTGLIDNYKVYPNPFDPSLAGDITFFFTALENGKATLQIFSIDGHLVYACTEQITVTANNQRVYLNWDARSKNSRYTAATGAYLARLVYTPANDKSSSVERIEKFIIYKQDN